VGGRTFGELRALNRAWGSIWDIELRAFFFFMQFVLLEVFMTPNELETQNTAKDITEQKRAEEALLACHLQLQKSLKLEAIGQLAGCVVHDLNNLVTVILGYSDLSLRQGDVDDSIRHNLEETKKAAERAASMIRQLLTLNRQLLAISREQILESKVLD